MKKFHVTIKLTESYGLEVEADSESEARKAALQKFGEMDYLGRSDALYEADSESYAEEVYD